MVLITGPSGSGKSFVAQALGQHACRSGFSVQYLRLPTLLNLFVQARAEGTYDRLLKRLSKIAIILIDDFGLAPLSDREKQDLLEALEDRYGTGTAVPGSRSATGTSSSAADASPMPSSTRLVHHAHCAHRNRCARPIPLGTMADSR